MRTQQIRPPAVAGKFYPATPTQLGRLVESYIAGAGAPALSAPKAVIAPHAGYIYSGPVAGWAFRAWAEQPHGIRRLVILGPSHYVAFRGLALPSASNFATPFGVVPVDADACERLRGLRQVHVSESAHAREHCIEVELPFLQQILPEFMIVPLVIGQATDAEVCEVVETLWGGAETRFVLSSDLSHYHDYETAREMDRATATAIEVNQKDEISPEAACGFLAIRGFLHATTRNALQARTLDLRNSGDTAGPRDSVVGYGAFAFG